MRIVQISDTHLSGRGGVTNDNFERIVTFVNEILCPDLVVNTGDLVAASPDDLGDREAARKLHSLFTSPVRTLPGNHDVGEPGSPAWMGLQVTSERIAAHRATFGEDRFLELGSDGAAIGINSELLVSDLPEESEQWDWLSEALAATGGRPTVLFLHKPLWCPRRRPQPRQVNVPAAARRKLTNLPGFDAVRAVGSGHLHRYRRRVRSDLLEVWAPSTGFVGQTETEPSHFEQLGVVEWIIADGHVDASFRAPVGLCEYEGSAIPQLVSTVESIRPPADTDKG